MRAVLDTNVLVSALVRGGEPLALLRAATEGELLLFTSPVLVAELRDVLSRADLARRMESRRASIRQAIALYAELAASVTPSSVPPVVIDDPDDDHVIAAAVASGADLIVSGDRHPLTLRNHAGIRIVTPAEALGSLRPAAGLGAYR